MLGSAAAAKSLQWCLTLCDPIDGSPPGSPVPGILQARALEWAAIASSMLGFTRGHFTGWLRKDVSSHPWEGKATVCFLSYHCCSVTKSCLTFYDLGPQHARLLCSPLSHGVCSKSCPLSQWCHPTTSSSVIPFSSCLQSFPASGSFPMNQLFESGGQNIGVSASASVLPMNIQDWFPLGLMGLISFQSKGTLKSLLQHYSSKTSVLQCSAFFTVHLSHPYSTGKTTALTRRTFVSKDPFIDQVTTNCSEPCVHPVASHQKQRKNPEQVRTQCIQLGSIISDG